MIDFQPQAFTNLTQIFPQEFILIYLVIIFIIIPEMYLKCNIPNLFWSFQMNFNEKKKIYFDNLNAYMTTGEFPMPKYNQQKIYQFFFIKYKL